MAEKERLEAIDGLRGLAVLATVALHWFVQPAAELFRADLRNVLLLAAYGVDLFFVVSGFLIGRILLKIEGNAAGMRAFYIRRVLRIWPPYYLLLLFIFLLTGGKFAKAPWWSFPLFIFNFWGGRGEAIHPSLYHLWSIAVEEQFYLIGPALFSLVKDRRRLALALGAYLLAAPFLRLALSLYTKVGVWEFTPARLDGICFGLLLALLVSSPAVFARVAENLRFLQAAALFSLAAAIPLRLALSDLYWFSFGNSFAAAAFALTLLVVYLQSLAGGGGGALTFPPLRYLGVRCYVLYLFHLPFMYISYLTFRSFAAQILFQTALTLLFAHLLWKYFEAPFIRWGKKFSYTEAV